MTRPARTALTTILALLAFAANSLLCRVALGGGTIDPASFASIRLVTGAAALVLISLGSHRGRLALGGSWRSAAMLFLYAVPFSFAYVGLTAGTGALILFAAVQATMLGAAIAGGERPHAWQWTGLALAALGLVYLVLPGLSAPPPPAGCALMAAAGTAWGVYSLRGRGSFDPLADTAGNFVRTIPFAAAVGLIAAPRLEVSPRGAMLAAASGALASGVGYAVWYAALRGLTAARAATVQLCVPVLAAAGGVVILHEAVSLRLALAAVLILGGVALALRERERAA